MCNQRNDNMKKIVFLIFVFSYSLTFGQTEYIKVENVSKDTNFAFPIVHSDDRLIELKINTHLQLAELELLKGHEKNNIFEKISFDYGKICGKVSISYQIPQNTKNVFSVKFDEYSCGLSCNYWVRYYNFNPQNGDRYDLQDFFELDNFETFRKLFAKKRKQKLLEQIKIIDMGKDTTYFLEYMLPAINDDDYEEFYFTSDSIYVDNFNLLNKNDKFLDLDNITSLAISEIIPLLNEFGKSALISANKLSTFISKQEPQLYFGKIDNKYDFVMLFKHSYTNNYYGVYAYQKYGLGIYLEGELINNEYQFKENNDDFETIGEINFKKVNNELIGIWSNKNKTKTLNLKAIRQ